MPELVLEIRNASVFRGQDQVLKNLNISIRSGERLVILGPNGAGKTTLIKLFTRELYPHAGDDSYLKLFGSTDINIWQLRKKVGVVSHEFQQQYKTISTGLDVILSAFFGSIGLYQHHRVSPRQRRVAEEKLDEYHIADLRDKQYLQLSAGQQRRLLLARSMVHDPDIIIFDEPTNGLDIASAFQIIGDIRKLAAIGKTIILVTHHLHEIVPEFNRAILLANGEIKYDGDIESALTSARLSTLFHTPMHITISDGFYQWRPA